MPKIKIPGAELHVLDRGQGPVVLFVHGFPLTHEMWLPQIEGLSDSYRAIAPDLRGFGKSSASAGTVSMRQFADDLANLLDAMEINEPVTFCGLSMGGYIGWQFVRHHRHRLNGLICCDTKASADSAEAVENRHKLAESVLKHGVGVLAQAMPEKLFAKTTLENQPETVEASKRMMLAADPEGVAAALRGMAERPDMTSILAEIDFPTMLIVGKEDQITTAEEMREIATAIRGSEFGELPNAGHMAPFEQPADVNEMMKRFLADFVHGER